MNVTKLLFNYQNIEQISSEQNYNKKQQQENIVQKQKYYINIDDYLKIHVRDLK